MRSIFVIVVVLWCLTAVGIRIVACSSFFAFFLPLFYPFFRSTVQRFNHVQLSYSNLFDFICQRSPLVVLFWTRIRQREYDEVMVST
ncbi:hypothetical protein JOB18_038409 [Solea senegalensis]|uniref:Secreted peptide n=1 Tax=Solea senegalensis TaxID=28829 RepID=A0AAV6TA10_SOLSE|nr:hypothetical protein JOB18_038409 [Solea senegalensis]